MPDNINAWNVYADEYFANATFATELIHIGLGIEGIIPSNIITNSSSILDIGCGNGLNTAILALHSNAVVVGIDPVASQIDNASRKFKQNNLQFICCEFKEIPKYISGTYDLITAIGSLDYIPIDIDFFKVMNKVTHKGSRYYISKFHPFWTTMFENDIGETVNHCYFDRGRNDQVKYGQSEFIRYHYSISDFIHSFGLHGWVLRNFLEPKPDFKNSAFEYTGYAQDPTLLQRLSKIPMTAVFEFERDF